MINYLSTISRILGVEENVMIGLEKNLNRATGRFGVLKNLFDKNEGALSRTLTTLGLSRYCSKKELEIALLYKAEVDDAQIFKFLGNPDLKKVDDINKVIDLASKIAADHRTGFFLKKEKAKEMMISEPPQNILKSLGYASVEEMLQREDLLEVYSGLRFLEDSEWLNTVFFKQYEKLTPADFEERQLITKTLDPKWVTAAGEFLKKKFHNVSHLKELGVIFVIPASFGAKGETTRLLGLLTHYFNEIYFYSDLFKMLSLGNDFSSSLISLLRGDVLLTCPQDKYLIIQRYLAKADLKDSRLYLPHLNPEALHWKRAEDGIVSIGDFIPELKKDLQFWDDLGSVGGLFKNDLGEEVVETLNLIDVVMSLVKGGPGVLYFYHLQEAMWNRIFIEYFGEEKVREIIKNNIIRGYFSV